MRGVGYKIFKQIQRARYVAIFLDYDGTLTPIVYHPSLAKLSNQNQKVLHDLSRCPGVYVSIVSGRSLSEIKKTVGVTGLTYVGNHGFQIQGHGICYERKISHESKNALAAVYKNLKQKLGKIPGIYIENKQFTVSVHYRQVSKKDFGCAKKKWLEVIASFVNQSRVITTGGKKVWEVRPKIKWNKGAAVLWLLKRIKERQKIKKTLFSLYIGDDQTDEDAFRAIRNRGIGIKVASDRFKFSDATYCLSSPKKVFMFLRQLLHLRRNNVFDD